MSQRTTGGQRIDQALVARGLARSRTLAREYLDQGRVRLNSQVVRKASARVAPEDTIEVAGEPERYVGRAAYKLIGALDRFESIEVAGRRCLDVGASTGGFSQVLLDRGARQVVALDVGHGQLADPVRSDPRVVDWPGTSIRDVGPDELGGVFDLVVADLSFISLTVVLARLAALTAADGDLVVLVKPQFEVGRERLGSDGVVRSAQQRAEAVGNVLRAADASGLHPFGLVASVMVGAHGNQEYLLWLRPSAEGRMEARQLTDLLETIR